jgi:Sulfotransferase domain
MIELKWRDIVFSVDDSKPGNAYFMMGVRKSGSTMFFKIAHFLARRSGYHYVDVSATLFPKNISVGQWVRDPSISNIIRGGNVYAGFRVFPSGAMENPIYQEAKKVLLIRDPRDALVSEYFSNAYSHSLPAATGNSGPRESLLQQRQIALATPIDEYVSTRMPVMRRTLQEYEPVLKDPKALILKYEDIVFRKADMINRILAHFNWQCSPQEIESIVGKVDIKPDKEDPKQFIRRVTPGDHRDKLQPSTISRINHELAGILTAMGYA